MGTLRGSIGILAFTVSLLGWAPSAEQPMRIVSLAPSVTEMLFAVGLGSRVVGVTTYCRFPEQVQKISKIGGYLTPSYEALAAVHADLAVVLPEHDDLRPHLEALGLSLLRVDHTRIAGILDSATAIGARCGAEREAAVLRAELQAGLDAVVRTIGGRPRPRVMVCLGRNQDASSFRSMTAAGPGSLHDDLIVRAGGMNVITTGPALYPTLSAEALVALDPDVIVELAPTSGSARGIESWRSLSSLRAVRAGRVYTFTQDFLSVPGPRLVRFVSDLARVLHPGAAWR